MIEYKCDNGQVALKIDGNIFTLAADVSLLMKIIYNNVNDRNPFEGYAFKELLRLAIESGKVFTIEEGAEYEDE